MKKKKEKQARSEAQQIADSRNIQLATAARIAKRNMPIPTQQAPISPPNTIDIPGSASGLSPYLIQYLEGPQAIQDFRRLRKASPKDALLIAIERVWGTKSVAKKSNNINGLAVLVKVLTGLSNNVTDRYISPLPVVVETSVKEDNHDES